MIVNPTALPPPQEVDALILAAGEGQRLGLGPKAMLRLNGHTLVEYVAHLARPYARNILIGTLPDLVDPIQALLPWSRVLPGGTSRQETLGRLLNYSTAPLLLILDAARPFTTPRLLEQILLTAARHGTAIPFIASQVPNALVTEPSTITAILPKERLLIPQTPQSYRRDILLHTYAQAKRHDRSTQSTLQLCHTAGHTIQVVKGDEGNIKITTPLDWQIAQALLYRELPCLDGCNVTTSTEGHSLPPGNR